MAEIIIRTENKEALQKIADFLKVIGFEVIFKDRPISNSQKPTACSLKLVNIDPA